MTNIERREFNLRCECFQKLMQSAKENIESAASLYVEIIDKYGEDGKQEFQKNNACFPRTIWNTLEMIGRKVIYPKIVFTRFSHDRRVISLPLSEQKRIYEVGVEYLTANNDSLTVRLDSMDEEQLAQISDGKKIRSLGEQRSYIEAQKNKTAIQRYHGNGNYRIEGNKVHILAPITLTKKQLREIINALG